MRKCIDLINKKFGRLTVIERVGTDKYKQPLWKCACDCGKGTTVTGISIRTGNTQSCGCLHAKVTPEYVKQKIREGHIEHYKAVLEEIKIFRDQGFRCVNLNKSPTPDFIALKDGKLFAVEVEFGCPNVDKYAANNPQLEYADIIWIKRRSSLRTYKKKSVRNTE